MSMTLDSQMNSVYLHGLRLIRRHQQEILAEWEKILLYLRKSDRKSEKDAELAIFFFSEVFFKKEFNEYHLSESLKSSWETKFSAPFQTNQYTISLLENSVHKVIQESSEHTRYNHQSVQYLFLTITEYILKQPFEELFQVETLLNHLVSSRQFPIEWGAVVRKEKDSFIVEKWFNRMNQDLLLTRDTLKADTIYSLSELLLKQIPEKNQYESTVLPFPYHEKTLLICVKMQDSPFMVPLITYILEIIQKGRDTVAITQKEQMWKDSVILFNESIMRSKTFTEAVENITVGFVNYLPFERCALFSYSNDERTGFGLYGQRLDNKAIQKISEEVVNLPIIQNNLQLLKLFSKSLNYVQPVYIQDASLGFPEHYIQQFQLRTVVIAPIYTSSPSKLLGAAILDQGPGKSFKITKETFSALVKFGQSAGEILFKYYSDYEEQQKGGIFHFSPREIEVLKLMAEGASTSEAASQLSLSEYTVRDYISDIMQKMDAKNRTEAVARAIRKGII